MVKYLLKKSYLRKSFKEVNFKDLWNSNGVFTTMWIYGKPQKILFFKSHINNLINSLKVYKIYNKGIKKKIIELIKKNIDKNKKYNHLLRIAFDKKYFSISFRDKIKLGSNFQLKLVNYKRIEPEYKNLKYKFILKKLSALNVRNTDIALCKKGMIFETGTSNLVFIKKEKIYSPKVGFYKGTNFKYLKKKIKKIYFKDIFLKDLNYFDEIILIGSGKGVTSVKNIPEINWKRKSIKVYKKFKNIYKKAISSERII